jgi:hypothetical protein
MSKWLMQGHFGHLHFNTFSMISRTPQCKVFWPLQSSSEFSGVPEDSKSPTLGVSFILTLGQSRVATLYHPQHELIVSNIGRAINPIAQIKKIFLNVLMQFCVGGFVFWDFAQNLLYDYFVNILYNEFRPKLILAPFKPLIFTKNSSIWKLYATLSSTSSLWAMNMVTTNVTHVC